MKKSTVLIGVETVDSFLLSVTSRRQRSHFGGGLRIADGWEKENGISGIKRKQNDGPDIYVGNIIYRLMSRMVALDIYFDFVYEISCR